MNHLIIEQRKLVDEVIEKLTRISDLNEQIKDENFITDIVCLIGQHRHDFEEQGVADHRECITSLFHTGSNEGNCGLMMFFGMKNKQGRNMISKAYQHLGL